MSIQFTALDSDLVSALRRGEPDANGQMAERHVAGEGAYPCRHCLGTIGSGEPYLILAHRPFPSTQPYAEVGPIFLHAEPCRRGGGTPEIPAMLASETYIVRGYGADDRIAYGTGGVVARALIPAWAAELLADPSIAYVHVRSAANNCYQCRIERS